MSFRTLSLSIVLLWWSLLAGGCTSYAPPALKVSEARALERTPDGVGLVFTLGAENTNDVPLPLRDVEYSLEIGGQRVFVGTRSAEATLRRLGSQTITLPASINAADHPDLAQGSGTVRYRLAGTLRYVTPGQIAEILFDTGVRVPSVDFASEGEVDLSSAKPLATGGGADGQP